MARLTSLDHGGDIYFRICFLILTVCLLKKANGLKCYKCESSKSFGDCDSNKTTQDCSSADERCVKFNYEFTKTSPDQQKTKFGRKCLTQSQCLSSLFPQCKALAEEANEDDKMKMMCNVHCCGKDFCNSQVKSNASFLCLVITSLVRLVLSSF